MGVLDQDPLNNVGHTTTNTYDALNRLTSSVAVGHWAHNLTYTYDRYGNMQCVLNQNTNGLCPQWGLNSATNGLTSPYGYDAAGHMTGDGTHTYQYDAEGRLATVDSGSTAKYVYNALGQRVDSEASGSVYRETYYDAFGRLAVTQNHTVTLEDFFPPVGGRDFVKFGGDPSGETLYLHADAQGTTGIITNEVNGESQDQTYYPYGGVWAPGTQAYDTRFGSLEERDAATGFDPTPARQYTSTLGRWMTPDPAGGHLFNPQTLNKYSYVRNNPVSLTDPTGLDFYLACNNSNHSSCTQVTINKTKYWVQSGANGNATIITSDSIRAGQNNAVVNGSGVRINGSNTGVYFDNPASHTTDANGNDVNNNPIKLQGDASKGFGGFSFDINGNCGGTCLNSGSFQFSGTPDQARAALAAAGAWNYGFFDVLNSTAIGHHPDTDQFRFGSGPSLHISVPWDSINRPSGIDAIRIVANPLSTVPATGGFHTDATTGLSHALCANVPGVSCN